MVEVAGRGPSPRQVDPAASLSPGRFFEAGSREMYDHALLFQLQHQEQRNRGEKDGHQQQHQEEEEEVRLGEFLLVRNAFVTMTARHEPSTVHDELGSFVHRPRESDPNLLLSSASNSTHGAAKEPSASPAAIHPLSVLYVQWLFSVDAFVDRFIEELRTLYSLFHNSTDCCQSVPDPDETVFVR
jgi:hypothetical protein